LPDFVLREKGVPDLCAGKGDLGNWPDSGGKTGMADRGMRYARRGLPPEALAMLYNSRPGSLTAASMPKTASARTVPG